MQPVNAIASAATRIAAATAAAPTVVRDSRCGLASARSVGITRVESQDEGHPTPAAPLHAGSAMRRFAIVCCSLAAACGGTPHASTTPARAPDQQLLAEAHDAGRVEQEALHVRQRVRTYLVGLGAVARPPRPAPRPEVPGPSPHVDAEWVAGHWIWEATAWVWHEGYWDWVESIASSDEPSGSGERGPRFRDHRRPRPSTVRDHRDGKPGDRRTTATVRDHRSGDRDPWQRNTSDDPPPVARPSREEPSAWKPSKDREETTSWSSSKTDDSKVRDHRDRADSKRDDDGPTIRDHRRGR